MTCMLYQNSQVKLHLVVFYSYYTDLAGTMDYKKELNIDIWAHCYVNDACRAPAFFPEEFNEIAILILEHDLNMQRHDINSDNGRNVYKHLVNVLST